MVYEAQGRVESFLSRTRTIYESIEQKGWYVYKSDPEHFFGKIYQGPVSELGVNGLYLVLPQTRNPCRYEWVKESLNQVQIKLHSVQPTVQIDNEPVRLIPFLIRQRGIVVLKKTGQDIISPNTFIKGLETLPDITRL